MDEPLGCDSGGIYTIDAQNAPLAYLVNGLVQKQVPARDGLNRRHVAQTTSAMFLVSKIAAQNDR